MAALARPRRRPKSWRKQVTVGQILIWIVLSVIFILVAYPFFYVLSLAVMPYAEYVKRPVHFGPAGFTLFYFGEILRDPRLVRAYQISIAKTVIGTTLNVVATMMAGYALSHSQLKYGRLLTFFFLVPMFFWGGLIPYYLVIRATGLLNSFWALVLPGLVGSFYLFIVRSYFRGYPREVIEAAIMDGAGHWGVFWRIVWPTSTPMIATIALLYGTGHWNDFFWPSILVQQNLHPAIVVLQQITTNRSMLQGLGLGQQMASQSFIAAMAAVVIIPILFVYPFIQRYVVTGIMIGSLKG